jgi:pilus assembly protein Flp/PilA
MIGCAFNHDLTRIRLPVGDARLPEETPMRLFNDDSLVMRLLRDDAGATAIEYGLIAALIAVAAIAAFQLVGTNLSTLFNTVATDL